MTLEQYLIQGQQSSIHTMAENFGSKLLNIRKQAVKESMTDIHNLSHRMELVAERNDVFFYDDSMASNINATWFTFESLKRRVVWIVRNTEKADYTDLKAFATKNIDTIICVGADADIRDAFKDVVTNIFTTDSLAEAVFMASRYAYPEDAVVYSPACVQDDYDKQGKKFKEIISLLG